ncbi:g25 [Coccomyxa elongata]
MFDQGTERGVVCRVCIKSCACDKQTICIVANSRPNHLQFDESQFEGGNFRELRIGDPVYFTCLDGAKAVRVRSSGRGI